MVKDYPKSSGDNSAYQQLWQTVCAIPLRCVLRKLVLREGWLPKHAFAVSHQYRKFLYLRSCYVHITIRPTPEIDMFWHEHILYTKKYAQDCALLPRGFMHHQPEELDNRKKAIESKKILYKQNKQNKKKKEKNDEISNAVDEYHKKIQQHQQVLQLYEQEFYCSCRQVRNGIAVMCSELRKTGFRMRERFYFVHRYAQMQ